MSSKLIFSDIIHTTIKSYSDLSKTELYEGKLQVRKTITEQLNSFSILDVLAVKELPVLVCSDSLEFNDLDIIEGSRRTFKTLTELQVKKGKLPVHSGFFKLLHENDTIIIILHSINHPKL